MKKKAITDSDWPKTKTTCLYYRMLYFSYLFGVFSIFCLSKNAIFADTLKFENKQQLSLKLGAQVRLGISSAYNNNRDHLKPGRGRGDVGTWDWDAGPGRDKKIFTEKKPH